jgi:hypothetical protein
MALIFFMRAEAIAAPGSLVAAADPRRPFPTPPDIPAEMVDSGLEAGELEVAVALPVIMEMVEMAETFQDINLGKPALEVAEEAELELRMQTMVVV